MDYRVRPTDNTLAWDVSPSLRSITLLPEFSKQVQASLAASTSSPTKSNGAGSPQEFVYDEVLTGSSNKEIYTRVARNYVTAAMEGYNSVVFAYGQTASGKTFTLVSLPWSVSRAITYAFDTNRPEMTITQGSHLLLSRIYLHTFDGLQVASSCYGVLTSKSITKPFTTFLRHLLLLRFRSPAQVIMSSSVHCGRKS